MNTRVKAINVNEEFMAENQSDHDIIINLTAAVRNNQTNVLEKIEEIKQKIQEINDGMSYKVNDHDLRIKSIERLVQITSPEQAFRDLQDLKFWRKQLDFRIKFILTIVFVVGGMFEWIVSESIYIFFRAGH